MFRGIFTSVAVVVLVLAALSTAAGSAVSAPLVAAAVAPPLEPLAAAGDFARRPGAI